jgi:hypothetical protein
MSFLAPGNNIHRSRNIIFPDESAALGFNPLSINTGSVLSQNNRVATGAAGAVTNCAANSQTLHTKVAGGKYYWELSTTNFVLGGSFSPPMIGIANADCGDGVDNSQFQYVFGIANGNFGYGGPVRTLLSPGNTAMLAIDFTGANLWIGRNGVWLNGGDPALGTLPDTAAVANGTYRVVFMGVSLGTPTQNVVRGRFGADEFLFPPPAGFLPWG